ncbi:BTAD domain-containing putative transcriptional regulator [Hyalangium rubrum]|uniref:BTAD domain-containing putative transcriptional regulator n=1 Tax=Hyalangium rubrum TaxID=3103134 RepID=A0ABU5H7Q1_9BACT|nr:BTAD domain-containing putative transcriptional regulator [Hyalangium sp. s54d21]MDY7229291.1 BTAD domain-containing putative transcriptional regulator [Hyalangium sp. s54d21]
MEIRVLAEAWAAGAQGGRVELERKSAALLAYLALEGPTARWKLSGLLWPESPEATARGNLRQLLKRLREQLGEDCTEGRDQLRLREGSQVDVFQVRAALQQGNPTLAGSFHGELLEGFLYDDCEELAGWLDGWRMKLKRQGREALEQQVQRLERERRYPEALDGALRLLELEPTAEAVYRQVMHLHHVLGNRPAALKAYRRCQEVLKRELNVSPETATRELARVIERSEAEPALPSPPARPAIRWSVLHPPVLAGREREWALMEEAWAARAPMFVDGESGIGKSRLVKEFGNSRGRCVTIEARPGDRRLPFATHMRSLRMLVRESGVRPQGWVRRELSRIIPELEDAPLPPVSQPEERARLFSAIIAFIREALRDVDVLVFDDGQYVDRDSAELGIQVHAEFREEMVAGRFPLIINAYRTSDVRDEWEKQLIHSVIDSGLMVRVPVGRLDTEAVRQMLRGMGEPALEQVAEKIADYTGGNPLFIVETARHLLRSGDFDGAFPSSLPPPGKVGAIIEQRLRLRSDEALRLARVFAVARTDFSAELAAHVLEVPVDQLLAPWKELEEAHIFQGRWFVHDAVAEVLLATMPAAIQEALVARIADYRRRHER